MGELYFSVLVDDALNIKEHGLSVMINFNNHLFLFDTAQSNHFLLELAKLGINEEDIEAIIISHGHYDHANGLRYIKSKKTIYINQDALNPKYKKEDGYFRYNGIDEAVIFLHKDNFIFVDSFTKIIDNFYIFGNIHNSSTNPKFVLNKKSDNIDDFHDEIFIVIDNQDGLSVFLGCSHFGVVEGLKKVKEYFPKKNIKNVIAGMHLKESDQESISEVIKGFKDLKVEYVYPLHCTGDLAIKMFKKVYQENCILINSSRKERIIKI